MAINCLENIIEKTQSHSLEVDKLINLLWFFVETDDLGNWDNLIKEKESYLVRCSKNKNDLPNDSEFSKVPNFILMMFVKAIEIGTSNLYGGTESFSHWTLTPTLDVLKLALENGFSIPPIESFEKSSFSEFHGWGNSVSREFFK